MNSTSERDKEKLSADFFNEIIIPLALREREAGVEFFPKGADSETSSYYDVPSRRVMRAEDFELPAAESIDEFIRALAALWTLEGHDELAAMAPRLLELAVELCGDEQEADEVSAFMYVMF